MHRGCSDFPGNGSPDRKGGFRQTGFSAPWRLTVGTLDADGAKTPQTVGDFVIECFRSKRVTRGNRLKDTVKYRFSTGGMGKTFFFFRFADGVLQITEPPVIPDPLSDPE